MAEEIKLKLGIVKEMIMEAKENKGTLWPTQLKSTHL